MESYVERYWREQKEQKEGISNGRRKAEEARSEREGQKAKKKNKGGRRSPVKELAESKE